MATQSNNPKRYTSISELLGRQQVEQRKAFDVRVQSVADGPFVAIEDVDVGTIEVDDYQRVLNMARVRRMVRRWKPLLLGVPELSRRTNGHYFVIDGQHRIAAIREMAASGKHSGIVRCAVWRGLTAKQEAEKFDEAQDPRFRKPITPSDRHKARVYRGESRAIHVDRLLGDLGWRVGPSRGDGDLPEFRAVETVNRLYEQHGIAPLEDALRVVRMAWDTSPSPDGPIVSGLVQFLVMYPDINAPKLVTRLRKTTMKDFRTTADDLYAKRFKGSTDRVTMHAFTEYNKAVPQKKLRNFDDRLDEMRARVRSETTRKGKARYGG